MEPFLLCPKCNGPMVSRSNGKTGQRFFGCRKYPDCKGTRNTDGEAPSETAAARRPAREIDGEEEMPSERRRQADRGRWREP